MYITEILQAIAAVFNRAFRRSFCKKLYRVLRDDEVSVIQQQQGIKAKDVNKNRTIESHVGHGGIQNYTSQFISCSTDIHAAIKFAQLKNKNKTVNIAEIDWDALVKQ